MKLHSKIRQASALLACALGTSAFAQAGGGAAGGAAGGAGGTGISSAPGSSTSGYSGAPSSSQSLDQNIGGLKSGSGVNTSTTAPGGGVGRVPGPAAPGSTAPGGVR
jgi:hypothetical protein